MPPRAKPAAKKSGQTSLTVERIKQYSGLVTVQRKVPVQVPGKMFAGLTTPPQSRRSSTGAHRWRLRSGINSGTCTRAGGSAIREAKQKQYNVSLMLVLLTFICTSHVCPALRDSALHN